MGNKMENVNQPLKRCLNKIDKAEKFEKLPNYKRFKSNMRELFNDKSMFKSNYKGWAK